MSEWKAKRFWKEARIAEQANGYGVMLDSRPVRTPAKAELVVPSRALAEEIAREWDAQEGEIKPQAMPVTRAVNAAIDKVSVQHAEVADLLADYGDSDLLCYRADAPDGLVARQTEAWDPMLDWAERTLGARLVPVRGVIHQPQNPAALSTLRRQVHDMDVFTLTAFHDLVGLSGSLILGFAALSGQHDIRHLWALSRIDETWQEEQWGKDDEATAMAAAKQSGFLSAKRFHELAQQTD